MSSVHFTNEPVLVDWPPFLPSRNSGSFRPHFLYIFQDHVAMSIKGLNPGEQLAIVTAGYEDLRMRSNSGLKNREGPRSEFMLFKLGDFVLANKPSAVRS